MDIDSIFLQLQKISGAFAKVDYDCKENVYETLIKVCAEEFVIHASHCEHERITRLPQGLKEVLMNAVLYIHNPTLSLHLLKCWTTSTLCCLLPEFCRTFKIFPMCLSDELRFTFYQFNRNCSLILQNLTLASETLRHVDLSHFPILDPQIEIVCSLVLKERIICLPPGFVLYINCVVTKRRTMALLRTAFIKQAAGKSQLKIVLRGLHVLPENCLEKMLELLQYVGHHDLQQFSCNDFGPTQISHRVLQTLKGFHSLKAINLPHTWYLESLRTLLADLVNIAKLDLEGIKLEDELENCLSLMYQKDHECCPCDSATVVKGKLTFLNLAGCYLTDRDILYLAASPHPQNLINLNLSENDFQLSCFLRLLQECKNLRVLEVRDCFPLDRNLNRLFQALPSLTKVVYLNLVLNLSPEYMLAVAPLIGRMPRLAYLKVRYPFFRQEDKASSVTFEAEYQHKIHSETPSRKVFVDFWD